MLYSHFTQNCIFLYFLEAKNPCFVTKNCSKSSYICAFILSKKQHNWFYKNLHNSGMVSRRKLPDPSLSCIFNAFFRKPPNLSGIRKCDNESQGTLFSWFGHIWPLAMYHVCKNRKPCLYVHKKLAQKFPGFLISN